MAQNKCWTADRPKKRGLNHPDKCPLCDQDEETINHLLVACVFARTFWYRLLRKLGLHSLAPIPGSHSFLDWWEDTSGAVWGLMRKAVNSLIMLGAWLIWKHRNRCVFDFLQPNLDLLLILDEEEVRKWTLVGAKGLSHLTAAQPSP